MYKFTVLVVTIILIRTLDNYFMEPYKTACFNNEKNPKPNVTIAYDIYDAEGMEFLEKQIMTINKNNFRVNVTLVPHTKEDDEWFSVEDDLRNCRNGYYKSYRRIQNCIAAANVDLYSKIYISTCIWHLTKSFGHRLSYPSLSFCARSPPVYQQIDNCIRTCADTKRQFDGLVTFKPEKYPLLIINKWKIKNNTYYNAIDNFSRFLKVNYGSYECRFYGPSYKIFIAPYLNFLAIVSVILVFICDVLYSADCLLIPLTRKEIYYSIENL